SAHDSLGIHGAEGRTCFVEPFLFEKHLFKIESRLQKICEILGQKVVCEEIDDINFEEIHGCTTGRQWQDQAQCRRETGVHETDRLSERAERLCCGPHRATGMRGCRCALEYAMADRRGSKD